MTPEGYDAFEDPYLYKGSQCLKNRLGIRDPERLAAFELEISTVRADEPLPSGRFGPAHYRRVHWHLFRDFRAGLPLDLSRVRPRPFLDAMIASFGGDNAALRAELAAMRV